MKNSKTITLLSGGLDSATTTALAIEKGETVIGLSFDYGQRHKRELEAAKDLAKHFNLLEHHIISVNLGTWGGSSLTDHKQKIPCEGIFEGRIPNTYVPGRNTVFISIALSLAEAKKANNIALGINSMDYSGYPDCRPDYLEAFQRLADLSSKVGREGNGPQLWAPLLTLNKVQIVHEAIRLKIPIKATWSCYQGHKKPCGICDSCRIRNKAFRHAGREDLCTNESI